MMAVYRDGAMRVMFCEFDYNGLNWRIAKRADTSTPPNGVLNQERRMYYSANQSSGGWQLIEEQIDEDAQSSFAADRRMEQFWGARYIDDIVLRREFPDLDNHPNRSLPRYHITDTLFSTVAVLNSSGKLLERVSYDAYGTARHHHPGDLTGDGAVGQDDLDAMADEDDWGVGDISRTGVVDSGDIALVQASKAAIAPGEISTTGNTIGYAGYVFNPEHVTAQTPGLYTVRHRHYEPGGGLGDASGGLGRWLSRDPLGYVDGMSLYEYVRARPVSDQDPLGLHSIGRAVGRFCRDLCRSMRRWWEPMSSCIDRCKEQINRDPKQQFYIWYRQERQNMDWIRGLPSCPCTFDAAEPETHTTSRWRDSPITGPRKITRQRNTWNCTSGRLVSKYQPGADSCCRSVKLNEYGASEQCCYDDEGKLITSGPGSGTSDRAPAGTFRHWLDDVRPFDRAKTIDENLGGGSRFRRMYCEVRPANNRRGCPDNPTYWEENDLQ